MLHKSYIILNLRETKTTMHKFTKANFEKTAMKVSRKKRDMELKSPENGWKHVRQSFSTVRLFYTMLQ